jgi:4-hydroxy-3-methylbut-2-en-1-yl diphosphate reductase
LKISIEESSGFCFGVTRVIKMAEEILDRGEKLYCLGEIVHNEEEVIRLKSKGLIFIEDEDLPKIKNEKVLIRAHGEPPATYLLAEKNGLTLIDGTCPIVLSLQKKIRKVYESSISEKDRIYIYGKEYHPEVRGLKGQACNNAIVIRNPEEIGKLAGVEKIHLFSQTTMDNDGFKRLEDYLNTRQKKDGIKEIHAHNSICKHISHRQPGIIQFARENDLIIFVSGKKSSNGRVLYEICQKENENSFFVSDENELKSEWINEMKSIGICGATSTPHWLLEQIAAKIESFTKN